MLINLDKKSLDDIVQDGVKEILGQICGRNRTAKKKVWFTAVKAVLQEYQHNIQEEFLPVLVQDFGSELIIKFSGGKINEEDIMKLNKFMEMVDKSNIKRIEDDLRKSVDDLKGDRKNEELNERLEEVKRSAIDGHEWIFRRLELHLRSVIKEEVYKNSVNRSNIEVMLYNFVEGDVPENVRLFFKNGIDSVPCSRMSKREIDQRVEEALVEYIVRLGRRKICGDSVMYARSVKDWIRKVKLQSLDPDSRKFVEALEEHYPALCTELGMVYSVVKADSKEELIQRLEEEGCVLVQCDKGMGMSLFSLETMRKADRTLMNQLGAVKMSQSKADIIESVASEIEKFEDGLDTKQQQYLKNVNPSRHIDKNTVTFPFLKSLHKIHKMSEEEIKNKDLSVLKFRPVVDARNWLTRGYASVAMQMMREASNSLVLSGGPVFRKIRSKDGWRFAAEVGDYNDNQELNAIVIADIQEAYTNITDVMIKKAIRVVGEFIGLENWRIELMAKLVDLVLGQNYAETSGGLFKFKEVLPMGYKLSGEALDIVALAEEVTKLYHLGEEGVQKSIVRVGELRSYPETLVDNSVEVELKMSKGIKKFKRYVDDVNSIISGSKEEILNGILAIGYLYPESLVVSMQLNIWHSRFLDVYFWRNFSGQISTVMRRNSEVPVGHVRKGSCHPEKYKLQSLLGEMLRGRRIASDEDLIEMTDKCLAHEFQSIGYSRREVLDAMEEAKKKVEADYCGQFVRINDDEERRFFRYGGGLIYNKNYRYGEVVMNFIDRIKPEGEPGIILLPDVKVKRIAYTKKRYLERQEEDRNK
jgi:hypothetical protein